MCMYLFLFTIILFIYIKLPHGGAEKTTTITHYFFFMYLV